LSDQRLRAMYPGGRGDRMARRFARLWAGVFAQGLAPRRWVTLEVRGRRSGRTVRFPLGMADWQGHWYLVPMLGERCNWVCNVRAADGNVALRRRGAIPCQLVEVPPGARAPIIKRYLEKVPGGPSPYPRRPACRCGRVRGGLVPYPRLSGGACAPVTWRRTEADRRAAQDRGPMTNGDGGAVSSHDLLDEPSRKRHWGRWSLGCLLVVVVVIVAVVVVFIELQPVPAPLVLPKAPAKVPCRCP
jgi:hypothetical protein